MRTSLAAAVLIGLMSDLAIAPAGLAQDQVLADGGLQYAPVQLEQMLAPVALYPDALLSDILMAATYPLEVVEADRWRQDPANAALQGDTLVAALDAMPWDPSIKSLVAFPEVLKMMDGDLDWTQQLGNAFVANQAAVMEAVQRLRQRAETVGSLHSTPQDTVTWDGSDVLITPTSSDVVYVPDYDPTEAYGPWPYPEYLPYAFPPFGGVAVAVVAPLWGWHRWDWHRHRIDIDDTRLGQIDHQHRAVPGGVWQHDPNHRHGVPYTAPTVRVHTAPGGASPLPGNAPAMATMPQGMPQRSPRSGVLIPPPRAPGYMDRGGDVAPTQNAPSHIPQPYIPQPAMPASPVPPQFTPPAAPAATSIAPRVQQFAPATEYHPAEPSSVPSSETNARPTYMRAPNQAPPPGGYRRPPPPPSQTAPASGTTTTPQNR